MSWYGFFRAVGRLISVATARIRTEGLQNIPMEGPCILVCNHQSFLDPIFIQSHLPRAPYTLTKSTQFGSPLFRWALPRLRGIPTRRYRVDPQVVRTVLRLLDQGEMVCVYPEGERSWDGRIQPLRLGTVRVILKAGVPVIPCGIAGSYDVVPRWSRTVRRRRVWITFGEPLRFDQIDDREERDQVVPEAHDRLVGALTELSHPPGTPWSPREEPRAASGEEAGTT